LLELQLFLLDLSRGPRLVNLGALSRSLSVARSTGCGPFERIAGTPRFKAHARIEVLDIWADRRGHAAAGDTQMPVMAEAKGAMTEITQSAEIAAPAKRHPAIAGAAKASADAHAAVTTALGATETEDHAAMSAATSASTSAAGGCRHAEGKDRCQGQHRCGPKDIGSTLDVHVATLEACIG
jgi:hypothetical protein